MTSPSGTSRLCGALALALLCGFASAQETPAPAPAPTGAPAAKPTDSGSMNFDLFDDKNKPQTPGVDLRPKPPQLDPIVLEKMVKRRRLVLQLHQGFGFATLITLAATVVIGQLNYVDKFAGNYTNRYASAHEWLAIGASALFATDAGLGLFAPTPYKKPIKADAALAHKVLMAVAAAGFITELILGPVTASEGGNLNQRNLALGHVVTGYTTFAAMLGGYLAYVF